MQSQRFAMCTTTVRAVSYSTKKDNVCTLPFDFSAFLLLTPDITVRYAGNLFVSFFAKCNPIITYLCNNRKLQRLVPEIPVGFLYQRRQLIGMMCGHCEARVKKALEAVDGVKEAIVSQDRKSVV